MRYFSLAVLALALTPHVIQAGPVISVDLDPGTVGIQSTATVTEGAIFTVDVVIDDDGQGAGATIFDTVILELFFNDSGVVLGAGPNGALGGTLAGNSVATVDLFGAPPPVMAATGSPLTPSISVPAAGFAAGSGSVGLFDLSTFTVTAGSPVSVFSFDFTALAAGVSTILPGELPPGALAFGGQSLETQFVGGSVTVEPAPNAVPEPHSLALLGIGTVCLGAFAVRRRRAS